MTNDQAAIHFFCKLQYKITVFILLILPILNPFKMIDEISS